MKMKNLKKVIASFMCAALVFVSAPQISASADSNQMPSCCGGSFYSLSSQDYDHDTYECHSLISKDALNTWANYIAQNRRVSESSEFLICDTNQGWCPSIIMEKADHEKTLGYYNPEMGLPPEKSRSSIYSREQAEQIINYGNIIWVLKYEINFIKRTFGNKYDRAISQVWEYIKSLDFTHVDHKILMMSNPCNRRGFFSYQFRE